MRKSMATGLLIFLLGVTSCGIQDQDSPLQSASEGSTEATPSTSSEAADSSTPDPSDDDSTTDQSDWPEAVDAADLTGPATVETIPDVEPIGEAPTGEFPVTVTDDRGQEVTVNSAERVLALDIYGTLSDITVGLGLGDSLVGRTSSDLNESLQDLPNVTEGGHSLNTEAILELEPDVILHDTTLGPRESLEQIEAAGIPVVYFTPDRDLSGVEDLMREVAEALGVENQAEDLVQRYQAQMETAEAYIEHLATQTSNPPTAAVLYVRGNAGVFFIMSADNGVADLMDHLRLGDAATTAGISSLQPANAEALAELNPDILLVMTKGLESTGGLDGLLARPGVEQTVAGQNKRVIDAPDSQLLSFGPNSPAALIALAEALYLEDPAEQGQGQDLLLDTHGQG